MLEHPKTTKRKAKLLKFIKKMDNIYKDFDLSIFGESYEGLYFSTEET